MKTLRKLLLLLALLWMASLTLTASIAAEPVRPPDDPQVPAPAGNGLDPRAVGYKPLPTTGTQPLLVVLARFSNRNGSVNGNTFVNVFKGTDGMSDYFEEVSFTKLNYSPVDIVGIAGGAPVLNGSIAAGNYVNLGKTIEFYADNNYGNSGGSGAAVRTALVKLANAGFDFAPYVTAGTNRVENLVLVYAGWSSRDETNPSKTLQATAYLLEWSGFSEEQRTITSNGVDYEFNQYTLCPDRQKSGVPETMGICTHEHGHGLGLPDLYDLSFKSNGTGYFDLMSYGTWGANRGERPYHMGAWSKDFLGWAEPQTPDTVFTSITLPPAATDETAFVKLYPNGNTNSKQFFMIENRQAVGFDSEWGARGLCEGVTIWHIDQNVVNNNIYSVNSPGYTYQPPPHHGVYVVEADKGNEMIKTWNAFGQCSDTWKPGQTWTNGTLWNKQPTGLTVKVRDGGGDNLIVDITQTAYLPKPTLTSPIDDATVETMPLNLIWQGTDIEGIAEKYKITLRTPSLGYVVTKTLTAAAAGCELGGTCTFSVDGTTWNLKQGKTYEWRVSSIAKGVVKNSAYETFVLNLPGAPVLQSPAALEELTAPTATFVWDAQNAQIDAFQLQVQVVGGTYKYTKILLPADVSCAGGGTCTFNDPVLDGKLKNNKTYRWKVTAGVMSVALATPWSKFTTKFVG